MGGYNKAKRNHVSLECPLDLSVLVIPMGTGDLMHESLEPGACGGGREPYKLKGQRSYTWPSLDVHA